MKLWDKMEYGGKIIWHCTVGGSLLELWRELSGHFYMVYPGFANYRTRISGLDVDGAKKAALIAVREHFRKQLEDVENFRSLDISESDLPEGYKLLRPEASIFWRLKHPDGEIDLFSDKELAVNAAIQCEKYGNEGSFLVSKDSEAK